MRFIELRIQIKALDEKIKPFDDLVEERAISDDKSHINNNAMLKWSGHEQFLDCNELESYRTLNYERFLLAQELEAIYHSDLLDNRKERIQIRRALRKAGIEMPKSLMICELREFIFKEGLA